MVKALDCVIVVSNITFTYPPSYDMPLKQRNQTTLVLVLSININKYLHENNLNNLFVVSDQMPNFFYLHI